MYDGGPAFRSSVGDGMSLRDYFAAHAPSLSDCMQFMRDWQFSEPQPQRPEGYEYFRRGGSADREELAEKVEAYDREQNTWCDRRDRAMYMAARWAYADAMLAYRAST